MKHAVTFVLGVALLVTLATTKSVVHGPVALVAFGLAWAIDRDVARGLGRPRAWALAMIVLIGLGAWLGPKDGTLGTVRFSQSGALAGVTMAARAVGLLLATTSITRGISPEAMLRRLSRIFGRPFAASVVVALRLAPEMAPRLRTWSSEARHLHPGLLRFPRRAFEVLVYGVVHAATLADDVAVELAAGTRDDTR